MGCGETTISRELKRNSTDKGDYPGNKAHDKAMSSRKRTISNKKLDETLVWHVKDLIKKDRSPGQTKGFLSKDGVSIPIRTIHNIINADTTEELMKHRRHPNFKRKPKGEPDTTKATDIANRTSIHDRPKEANGTHFGDWESSVLQLQKTSYPNKSLILHLSVEPTAEINSKR